MSDVSLYLILILLLLLEWQVYGLAKALSRISEKEYQVMALAQDILDAVAAETSVVDSFLTLVQGLIDNNTITPAQGTAILEAINAEKAKVEAAIVANTTPTP